MTGFGASAPSERLYQAFGITAAGRGRRGESPARLKARSRKSVDRN